MDGFNKIPLVEHAFLVLESFFFLYSTNARYYPRATFFVMTALSTRTHKTNDQSNPMNPNPRKQQLRKPLLLRLLSTTQQTSPSGSDETRLLTLCSITRDGRSFTNMLVVTL